VDRLPWRNKVVRRLPAQSAFFALGSGLGIDVCEVVLHRNLILDADEAEDVSLEPDFVAGADGVLVCLGNGTGDFFFDLVYEVVGYVAFKLVVCEVAFLEGAGLETPSSMLIMTEGK
jgi:hypothetical protein